MSSLGILKRIVPIGLLAVVLFVACKQTGDTQHLSEQVSHDDATSAVVNVRMDVGDLDIDGGADGVLDGDFRFNIDDWEPNLDWTVKDGQGRLTVEQDGSKSINVLDINDVENDWDLRLNDDLPLTLDVELGAGKSNLRLGSLALTELTVETGVGDTTIDLTGEWGANLNATIDAGAGRVTLVLPSETGVRVETDTGLVDVDRLGLVKDGNVYTNDSFGTSAATLTIRIETGVGQIRLEVAD